MVKADEAGPLEGSGLWRRLALVHDESGRSTTPREVGDRTGEEVRVVVEEAGFYIEGCHN